MADSQTCLFVGRFQPFHRGHLMVIQGMTKVCDKIVIVVGSCDESGTEENPFTSKERQEMIQRGLQDEDIIPNHDVVLVEVPDVESDEVWTQDIMEQVGEVDTLWTGNDRTKKCFADKNVDIQEIKEVPGISATEIRKRMKEGGDWEELVQDVVASYIKQIDGVERVQ